MKKESFDLSLHANVRREIEVKPELGEGNYRDMLEFGRV